MAKTKKTYSIYVRSIGEDQTPIGDYRILTGFQNCMRSYVLGAMHMAKSFYGDKYEFVCKCDQTEEEIEHVYPRRIRGN